MATAREPDGSVQRRSVKGRQAAALVRRLRAARSVTIQQSAAPMRLPRRLGQSFAGVSPVTASVSVAPPDPSTSDLVGWWAREPVRYRYSAADLEQAERVGETSTYLVKTEQRQTTLLDGRTFTLTRDIFYEQETRRRWKQIRATDVDTGRTVPFDRLPMWLLGLYGVNRVEITPASTIVVTEGYPAADALHARGIDAVAIQSGAVNTPSENALAPLLPAQQILLWPDNDHAGAALMLDVARTLHAMGVETARIGLVRWEGGPRKGDAADVEASDRDIRALLRTAMAWSPDLRLETSTVGRLDTPRTEPQLRLDDGVRPPTPPLRAVATTEKG